VILAAQPEQKRSGVQLLLFGLNLSIDRFAGFAFDSDFSGCARSFEAGETQPLPASREIAEAARGGHL
jgi:hypothetical protein